MTRAGLNSQPCWLLVGLLFLASSQVAAQGLRDPTIPPPVAAPGGIGSAETPLSTLSTLGIEAGAVTIIVRNGQPHLVIGAHLYAQGSKIGQIRVERITETEIWLREGRVLHKVLLFRGIQRRAVTPLAAAPVCAPNALHPSPPATACIKARP